MTAKLFFTEDGAGEHPGPTNFRDFALMPFGKLMLLLIPRTWNAYLFQFLAWLPPLVKSILPALTGKFIEKQLLREKFCS